MRLGGPRIRDRDRKAARPSPPEFTSGHLAHVPFRNPRRAVADGGGGMTDEVRDIWFRSTLPLAEIARRLGLQDVTVDSENYWEWVIGTLGDVTLDITRTHTRRRWQVDTVIFLIGDEGNHREFSDLLIADVVGRLRSFVTGSVFCGRMEHCSGNDSDLVVVRELKPTT